MYTEIKLSDGSLYGVKRASDGAIIPADEGNRDWVEYQSWLAEGNKPNQAAE